MYVGSEVRSGTEVELSLSDTVGPTSTVQASPRFFDRQEIREVRGTGRDPI